MRCEWVLYDHVGLLGSLGASTSGDRWVYHVWEKGIRWLGGLGTRVGAQVPNVIIQGCPMKHSFTIRLFPNSSICSPMGSTSPCHCIYSLTIIMQSIEVWILGWCVNEYPTTKWKSLESSGASTPIGREVVVGLGERHMWIWGYENEGGRLSS